MSERTDFLDRVALAGLHLLDERVDLTDADGVPAVAFEGAVSLSREPVGGAGINDAAPLL
ncbi:MAG: hypothetical protein RLO45_14750 [Roseovarius indicus]